MLSEDYCIDFFLLQKEDKKFLNVRHKKSQVGFSSDPHCIPVLISAIFPPLCCVRHGKGRIVIAARTTALTCPDRGEGVEGEKRKRRYYLGKVL